MHQPQAMKVLLAIDSFKGCLTSQEVEAALAVCLRERGMQVQCLPMSDGGDGMLQSFAAAMGGRLTKIAVHDPLMRTIYAHYAVCPDGTAIIETAQACGLSLMHPSERNPLVASTYGVGELLLEALEGGCRKFIIGLGGSGTSDAGQGMLKALSLHLTSGQIESLPYHRLIQSCHILLASDVTNPLYGPQGAARVYGKQKGANEEMQEQLDQQARAFALRSAQVMGYDHAHLAGAGAAGGLGYAFLQFLGAECQSGADILLRAIDFQHLASSADLVITGEGAADRQTLMGKLPMRVLLSVHAQRRVPVWLIAGQVSDRNALLQAGFQRVDCINPAGIALEEAMRREVALAHLHDWAMQVPLSTT